MLGFARGDDPLPKSIAEVPEGAAGAVLVSWSPDLKVTEEDRLFTVETRRMLRRLGLRLNDRILLRGAYYYSYADERRHSCPGDKYAEKVGLRRA